MCKNYFAATEILYQTQAKEYFSHGVLYVRFDGKIMRKHTSSVAHIYRKIALLLKTQIYIGI